MDQETSRDSGNGLEKVPFKLPPRVRVFSYGFCIFMMSLSAKFLNDGFIHPGGRSHEAAGTLVMDAGWMLLSAAIVVCIGLVPDWIGRVPHWLLRVWKREEWEKSISNYWWAEEKIFRGKAPK